MWTRHNGRKRVFRLLSPWDYTMTHPGVLWLGVSNDRKVVRAWDLLRRWAIEENIFNCSGERSISWRRWLVLAYFVNPSIPQIETPLRCLSKFNCTERDKVHWSFGREPLGGRMSPGGFEQFQEDMHCAWRSFRIAWVHIVGIKIIVILHEDAAGRFMRPADPDYCELLINTIDD